MLFSIAHAHQLPPGTVVPIQLSTGLNANKDDIGKKIKGKVMQEVLLTAGDKIKEGARVTGHVVRTMKRGPSGSSIIVQFDVIQNGDRTIPLTVSLLAVASASSVDQAQTPINATSNIDPTTQWVTRQVGGDIVRRGWGKAGSSNGVLGRWVGGTSVIIKLTPNPDAGCPEIVGYDREQAVWVFSSAACGTYGLSDAKITHSGATAPIGEISLSSDENIAIRAGSGWLLMVASE
jgi:hypothetical protein